MPLSRISANLPKTRTNPFGTTVLYSNQKSNKSPNRNNAVASFLISSSQATNFCSLGKLNSGVGAPKCWSEAKYILVSATFIQLKSKDKKDCALNRIWCFLLLPSPDFTFNNHRDNDTYNKRRHDERPVAFGKTENGLYDVGQNQHDKNHNNLCGFNT